MNITLSLALTLAAIPALSSDMVGLKAMQEGGPAVQSAAFTGERASDGAVVASGGKWAEGSRPVGYAPIPVVAAVPPAPAGSASPDASKKGFFNPDKLIGVGAVVAGSFWLAMGSIALAAGAVTIAGLLPVIAGIAALGFGIGLLTGKIKL